MIVSTCDLMTGSRQSDFRGGAIFSDLKSLSISLFCLFLLILDCPVKSTFMNCSIFLYSRCGCSISCKLVIKKFPPKVWSLSGCIRPLNCSSVASLWSGQYVWWSCEIVHLLAVVTLDSRFCNLSPPPHMRSKPPGPKFETRTFHFLPACHSLPLGFQTDHYFLGFHRTALFLNYH